ncbi:MAG: metalloregulator ArsR/SmtB family transcription factor [Thalassotalea sp.]
MAVEFFKALADETRLLLLMLIAQEQELCVCDLTFALALSQPKISRHLALLREREIIQARRQGKWMYYRINDALPAWQLSAIQGASLASAEQLKAISLRLAQSNIGPVRQQCC